MSAPKMVLNWSYRELVNVENIFDSLITLLHFLTQEARSAFPKEDVRVFVATMHEASPRYNEGVKDGGKHLMKDGRIIRSIKVSISDTCIFYKKDLYKHCDPQIWSKIKHQPSISGTSLLLVCKSQ